ncbi:MAG TPA: CocE/NonD family hydrolase, partial [Caldilineaceae bacterium]|nr:CocE/NonD family hydrolase [Caldilineaceae bacterium]
GQSGIIGAALAAVGCATPDLIMESMMAASAILYPAPGVKQLKNVMIPMRDGVRLAADLYLPDSEAGGPGAGRFPLVMEYVPYRKDEIQPTRADIYTYLPQHGYGVARVDIRGTGGSEGVNTDEYTLQEQLDGYDAIEWLAGQPWCDGQVNLMGVSYGGFSALQVATHQPPHLTTIIPIYFTDDRYTDDCHYRGGLLRLYYDIGYYGNFMVVYNALPPYPEWAGADWAAVWEQHLAENEPYFLQWIQRQTDGPYWRHGSVRDIPERIRCPVFLIGGWRDGYPNPPLRLYQALAVPRKVVIGPWDHALPDVAFPGPRIDYLQEVGRWLD